jgi:O-succinylbenzoic acid--CoA ligase
LVDRATAAGIAIQKSYGLTEMASQVATTRRLADRDELATSGEILPFREVRISDQGEISVRGATLFAGYVGRDSLERPFEDDGWFATGDLGRFDVRGRLIVSGRKDATFISGGENVHPEEIEEAILATGLVDRAVVVPIENEEYGQRPIAFVSPLPNESTLRTLLKDRIATFKIPDSFLELPPDTGLKPDRRILKAMANKRLD